MSWYTTKGSMGQGLVIDEADGRNVAVAYDEKDAPLLAAAPDMLEALCAFLRAPHIGSDGPGSSTIVVQEFNLRQARAAIDRTTG